MSRSPISLEELKEAAQRIPERFIHTQRDRDRVVVALGHRRVRHEVYMDVPLAIHEPIRTIEFRAERIEVRGVPATAWFHGDVIVKVSV